MESSTWLSKYSWLLYELQPVTFSQLQYLYTQVKVFFLSLPTLLEYAKHTLVLIKDIPIKSVLGFVVWAALWRCSAFLNLASLYFMASCFILMFLNLGERRAGEMSAYSVFNEGFARLLGTMTAEQIDREMRHEAAGDEMALPHMEVLNEDGANREVVHRGTARRSNKKKRRNYENREMRRRTQEHQEVDEWND